MTNKPLTIVIPAAGRGSRMQGSTPKVLLQLGGKTVIEHVIDRARTLSPGRIIVIEPATKIISRLSGLGDVLFVDVTTPTGVASTIQAAESLVVYPCDVLVMLGDSPMVDMRAVGGMLAQHRQQSSAMTLLTGSSADQYDYSEITRTPSGSIQSLALQPPHAGLHEYSLGPIVIDAAALFGNLRRITPVNGEYRLESIVELLVADGLQVSAHSAAMNRGHWGINTAQDFETVKRDLGV